MLNVVLLLGSALAIYLSCELFVNAVEHLGRLLKVGTLAIGTVLAAVGTALPESVVTGVAVTLAHEDENGVGAALGGPLALATIAYTVVGVTLLVRRQPMPRISTGRLARDQTTSPSSRSRQRWVWSPSPGSPGWGCCSSRATPPTSSASCARRRTTPTSWRSSRCA